eukprot:jgi/Ulvmu1/3833/UM018_0045.1
MYSRDTTSLGTCGCARTPTRLCTAVCAFVDGLTQRASVDARARVHATNRIKTHAKVRAYQTDIRNHQEFPETITSDHVKIAAVLKSLKMPDLKIHTPADREELLSFSREYALLRLMQMQGKGAISSESVKKYTDDDNADAVKKLVEKGEISFKEFAEAFRKSGEATDGEGNATGMTAHDDSGTMKKEKFTRREPRENDVVLQITYCGMCHSDVHQVRGEWGNSIYPMIPGHEIIGVVIDTGDKVTKFKVGDSAAVGCMVDSCLSCSHCKNHDEQYCSKGNIGTYNSKGFDGEVTMGGYSTHLVCREEFVVSLPENIHSPGAAPLLCAGITTYSPMKHYGADKEGMRIGVVGCGGLGHMAIKLAKAFGQHVTVLSRSYRKKDMAMSELKADDFVATSDEETLKSYSESFDAIIDTVSAEHDINQLLGLLKVDGKLICVGVSPTPYQLAAASLVMKRRMIGGSLIGGIKETQEVLDFCSEHNILATVEEIPASRVNEGIDRIVSGDVHFRFCIDMLGTLVHAK